MLHPISWTWGHLEKRAFQENNKVPPSLWDVGAQKQGNTLEGCMETPPQILGSIMGNKGASRSLT